MLIHEALCLIVCKSDKQPRNYSVHETTHGICFRDTDTGENYISYDFIPWLPLEPISQGTNVTKASFGLLPASSKSGY